MNKIFFILVLTTVSNCESSVPQVKPGEVKHIPYSTLYAVGTDSTIVIIDREKGKVTETINRYKTTAK